MNIAIHLGWWAAPLVVTLMAFGLAAWSSRDDGYRGDYAAVGAGVVGLMMYGAATIVSLLAWLAWAVLV
jgi:hypothetical protein